MTNNKITKRVVGPAVAPDGQPGYLIECTCATHEGHGQAVVSKLVGENLALQLHLVHGTVTLAHSPLGRASVAPGCVREHVGPWAV